MIAPSYRNKQLINIKCGAMSGGAVSSLFLLPPYISRLCHLGMYLRKNSSQTFVFVSPLVSPEFIHWWFIRYYKIFSLKIQIFLKKKEETKCGLKSADCFPPNPYHVNRSFELLEERILWCGLFWGFLDLAMTLKSRTFAKKKRKRKERERESSASD